MDKVVKMALRLRPTKPDDQHWDAKVHSRGFARIDDDFGDGGRAH